MVQGLALQHSLAWEAALLFTFGKFVVDTLKGAIRVMSVSANADKGWADRVWSTIWLLMVIGLSIGFLWVLIDIAKLNAGENPVALLILVLALATGYFVCMFCAFLVLPLMVPGLRNTNTKSPPDNNAQSQGVSRSEQDTFAGGRDV